MNFEEILQKITNTIIKNKDKLPIENSGVIDVSIATYTALEDNAEEITKLIIEFCQYQDGSFHIESSNLVTTMYSEDGKIIRSEMEEIVID